VLERCGALVARGVALRPAHPVLLAVVDQTPVIGVPGYPVSAALACERFAEPVLARLSGTPRRSPPTAGARLARPVFSRRDAEVVVPVVLERGPDGQNLAWPQSRRGGALAGLARADATLSVAAGAPPLDAGDHVCVELRR
jgi:putative molybdopterin biosynthesis protein